MGLKDNSFIRRFVDAKSKKSGSSAPGIIIAGFAACGGVLFGFDTGTILGIMAMDYVLERFPSNKESFTSSELSLIVSILSVGTFFGALSAPLFADSIGRRWTVLISTFFVFNLGIILQTAATSIPLLCVGRLIGGLGVGMISSVVPLYQAETLPEWIRGAVVSAYQLAITIGLLLAACVNQGTHQRNDSGSYRIPIAIQFLWGLILGIGFILLPETPRFWICKGKDDKAKASLSRLRKLPPDHPEIIEEYEDIKAAYVFEAQFGKNLFAQVFSRKGKQLKRLFTAVTLQAFQQLSGINFIFYFGTQFFKDSGIENPFTVQLATNIVNVGSTVPGLFFMEIIGRRKLLITGAAFMSVFQLIIASVGVASDTDASKKILVAFTCLSIASFAMSWGEAWVVSSEIFTTRTRAKSVSLATASNWLWNWAIAYATPYLVDKEHANLGSKIFFVWGGFNLVNVLFSFLFIYETKGLTLEQVDELYENVSHAWLSSKFVPSQHAFRPSSPSASIHSDSKADAISVEERSV
ncbi:hypothetical protein QCA50_019615 [Cerrena zonata]|uniref:General substrate transporter n=2 Tax=Dikarya TaxID=451864 RepID=A0A1E4RS51_9ASCO|nr:general substrate transporter [Hyphopichia burtonii NRRL Y-1933]ODV70093.1 general substrate transporter [Hyphopichia burtonii NRRL Y-1933]